ncbi:LacI family DNA-binding transcriptional regulator [Winogradskyella endarachnes]|uniref:LacI family DNA-binding transcriptional regulator n=1 Tax=Winogradskyella endarachnes TaxID=2681965 RepID=A0A6L6UAI6_9FLAO|nr:LacI family DNA-binding transcriptional regulator [Winogradskyella endarachnes]MUU79355.1 LacI family DNA-binding transcriptional regulator [Winogradskyella endarachnes]
MSSAVTIKEISNLSGYSISTVSKALNNKLEISKATRDAIKSIAKQHNYVPNNYAVSLRMQKTGSIAVILPEVTQSHFGHSLCHLQKSAESLGYRILFYQSFNCNDKALSYIKSLSDGSIDGIIVVSSDNKSKSLYKENSFPVEFLHLTADFSLDEIKQQSYKSLTNVLKN